MLTPWDVLRTIGPWQLFLASDAAVQLVAGAVLFGFVAGALCVRLLAWRRFARPSDECLVALRQDCRDLRATVTRLRREREASDAQVRQLYSEQAVLARRLVEMAGRGAARKGAA